MRLLKLEPRFHCVNLHINLSKIVLRYLLHLLLRCCWKPYIQIMEPKFSAYILSSYYRYGLNRLFRLLRDEWFIWLCFIFPVRSSEKRISIRKLVWNIVFSKICRISAFHADVGDVPCTEVLPVLAKIFLGSFLTLIAGTVMLIILIW